MPFSDLQDHVQQTFASLAGYASYESQLTLWCYRQKASAREADKAWKARNRQREAARLRLHHIRHRDEILASKRANAKKHAAATKRWRERNREALRAKERQRWHARQEAKKAAGQAA